MLSTITDFLGRNRSRRSETDGGEVVDQDATNGRDGTGTENDVVERLVDGLRNGDVTEEQRSVLRDHLVADVPTRIEVRIDDLQSKIGRLDAYTGALEAFLDEGGTAEEVLEDIRGSLDHLDETTRELRSRIESVEHDDARIRNELANTDDRLAELDEYVDRLEGRHSREIAGVDSKIEDVDERLEELVGDVGALADSVPDIAPIEESVVTIETDLEGLEDRLEAVADEVDEFEGVPEEVDANRERIADVEALRPTVESVSERLGAVEELADEVDALRSDLGTLQATVGELESIEERVAALESLQEDVGNLDDEIEELNRFRRRLIDSVSPLAKTSTGD